jgi:type IV pilus assembly protein PilE
MKNVKGFNLIEILSVLAIVCITTTLAYPLYSQYLVQTSRIEAENTLVKLALAMEQYRTAHHSYTGSTLSSLNFPAQIAKNHYQLSIESANDNEFLLAAIPIGKQAENDAECSTLTLCAHEEKGIRGNSTVEHCW